MKNDIVSINKNYQVLKEGINNKISKIRYKILKCDPLNLLKMAFDARNEIALLSSITWENEDTSEFKNSGDATDICELSIQRLAEYIQSVFAASAPSENFNSKDCTTLFEEIKSDFYELYKLTFEFYLVWGNNLTNTQPELTDAEKNFLVEAQALYQVRGKRHQIHEIEYIESLLKPHDPLFQRLFNISVKDITEGLKKLEYSLSQGSVDIFADVMSLFENRKNNSYNEDNQEIFNNAFGVGLKDVVKVTNWPEKFVKALSWEIGEDKAFFSGVDFPGWPIIDLSIAKRPFIIINKISYCFDYYSLVDNFYRALQKAVSRTDKTYKWSDFQQIASEDMVEEMFQSILPNSTTFKSNYYYPNNEKDYAENDLLVLYDDTLLIIEVKAGSFVYTAPMLDYAAHVKSYKTLIEKADQQCARIKSYLLKSDSANIYDSHKNIKAKIDMKKFSKIYCLTVTMDNINSAAAKAEKLAFLNLQSDSISIAIDDLMIYRDYFDSSLKFLHFLKERTRVTKESKLVINDEMEHLGLYINHNCYHMLADKINDGMLVSFDQYRVEISNYFSRLYHTSLKPIKPSQDIPLLFNQIIDYLEKNKVKKRSEITNYFLDLSTESKQEFSNRIDTMLTRQEELKRELLIKCSERTDGAAGYTCCVHQDGIFETPYEVRKDSTLSSLLWNGEHDRYLIDIYFNQKKEFKKIEFMKFNIADISEDELPNLKTIGLSSAKRLVQQAAKANKTIGRNELCPCGSGKKFKQCCLKRNFF